MLGQADIDRKVKLAGQVIHGTGDVLESPRCRGRMRIVAAIDQPEVIVKILTHLGLPARAPRPCAPLAARLPACSPRSEAPA
jgi:hypothetical protein